MRASRRQETKAAEEGFEKIKGSACYTSDGIACKYTTKALECESMSMYHMYNNTDIRLVHDPLQQLT